ncbi:unnamed protein product, partial [Mesorhabditis belari]|uniref:Uncharacterized protein n=1 Tax=Mesorhabditis belari TaxID=2138241 RepID=A0AAF3E994_9BILA
MTTETGKTKTMMVQVMDANRRLIFSALDEIEGQKTLVWRNREMMRHVNLFAGAALLKEHEVTEMFAFYQPGEAATRHVIYLLPPTVAAVEELIEYMMKIKNENSLNYVYFIPDDWFVARERLKECASIYSKIEWVRALPLSWLSSPIDVITLNLPDLHSRLLLNGDWTYLHKCARSLEQLSSWCGHPVPIYAKGKWAEQILNMFGKIRSQQENVAPPSVSTLSVGKIIMVDRWMDPVTPLLTQLTYSGLLAEVYDYQLNGKIIVPEADFEGKETNGDSGSKEIPLPDEVFDRVKHAHFNAFSNEISPVLKEIREDESHDRDKMSVAEIKQLVKKLPAITYRKKLASQHMRLAEMLEGPFYDRFVDTFLVEKDIMLSDGEKGDKVNSHIEDAIIEDRPLNEVLRLIALQSLCSGGLKSGVLQVYDRLILHTYGVVGMDKMLKMRKIGMVKERGATRMQCHDYGVPQWTSLKKSQRLLVDEDDELSMTDLSAPYSGYVPLLVRSIEEGAAVNFAGWQSIIDEEKRVSSHGAIVIVIGGITAGEAACLKRMPFVSLIASSDITNGNRFLDFITNIVD